MSDFLPHSWPERLLAPSHQIHGELQDQRMDISDMPQSPGRHSRLLPYLHRLLVDERHVYFSVPYLENLIAYAREQDDPRLSLHAPSFGSTPKASAVVEEVETNFVESIRSAPTVFPVPGPEEFITLSALAIILDISKITLSTQLKGSKSIKVEKLIRGNKTMNCTRKLDILTSARWLKPLSEG